MPSPNGFVKTDGKCASEITDFGAHRLDTGKKKVYNILIENNQQIFKRYRETGKV